MWRFSLWTCITALFFCNEEIVLELKLQLTSFEGSQPPTNNYQIILSVLLGFQSGQ